MVLVMFCDCWVVVVLDGDFAFVHLASRVLGKLTKKKTKIDKKNFVKFHLLEDF